MWWFLFILAVPLSIDGLDVMSITLTPGHIIFLYWIKVITPTADIGHKAAWPWCKILTFMIAIRSGRQLWNSVSLVVRCPSLLAVSDCHRLLPEGQQLSAGTDMVETDDVIQAKTIDLEVPKINQKEEPVHALEWKTSEKSPCGIFILNLLGELLFILRSSKEALVLRKMAFETLCYVKGITNNHTHVSKKDINNSSVNFHTKHKWHKRPSEAQKPWMKYFSTVWSSFQ